MKYVINSRSFLISAMMIMSINIFGQEKNIKRNVIYYELGGTGLAPFSVNYERDFSINEKVILAPGTGISLTRYINVGGTYNVKEYQLFLPIQVNFIFGEKYHRFEVGYGMPIAIKNNRFGITGNIYVLRLGYRYQKRQSGFLFRASINPSVIVSVPTIMGGLSIGYVF